MLEFDRTDISEEIDMKKTNASNECKICHYRYFKDIGFIYEPHLCNGCHALMQKAVSFNDDAIVDIKESTYRIHFGKDDAVNIMNNSSLIDKIGVLYFFLIHVKK